MEDATHSPSVFSQGLTRRPPGRISNGSPGYWPCVAREGVEARISPKSVPCTDLAICWGAFVGWDAIFDFRSSIRSTDLGKHQCFRAEFQAASIPLKYHGVRLFSYDFKECHAWYHPGTPPKKPSLKLMFIETSIFHVKVLNHSIKTTIYKWMFQVPGWYLIFQLWVLYSPPPRVSFHTPWAIPGRTPCSRKPSSTRRLHADVFIWECSENLSWFTWSLRSVSVQSFMSNFGDFCAKSARSRRSKTAKSTTASKSGARWMSHGDRSSSSSFVRCYNSSNIKHTLW